MARHESGISTVVVLPTMTKTTHRRVSYSPSKCASGCQNMRRSATSEPVPREQAAKSLLAYARIPARIVSGDGATRFPTSHDRGRIEIVRCGKYPH